MQKEDFAFIQLSSLEKVFLDEKPTAKEFEKLSVLKNEKFSYQIAYSFAGGANGDAPKYEFKVSVDSPLKEYVNLRLVGNVPVELSHYSHACDDGYLRKCPGLYPDSLLEMNSNDVEVIPDLWHSLWITMETSGDMAPGNYDINVVFENSEVKIVKTMSVKIIDAMLPEQETIVAYWNHPDCLASVYNVKMYSKRHWEIIDSFIKSAIDNGVNSIYTPVLSIPNEISPGLKRPECQLVDITVEDGQYIFNFDKLRKWISIFKKYKGRYLEIAHLFSQWGAKFAPRVVARVNGKRKDIFGWHTPNNHPEYKRFLGKLLPELAKVLKEENVADRTFYHISDEPHLDKLDSYLVSKGIVDEVMKKHKIKDYKVIEACSEPEAYTEGGIDYPVVHLPRVEDYLEKGITPFGAYYCCSTNRDGYANRFIDMPSYRSRILGVQMFKYNIKCNLHFGYSYYFKRSSTGGTADVINPFFATDAGNAVPGGNTYLVYPGSDGKPVESIRLHVCRDMIYDIRAMKLLESYIGHGEVVKIIEEYANMEIKMNKYPKNAEFLLGLREIINNKIEEVTG